MNKFSLNLRGAMEAHQTSNLGVLSSSLSEDVFILSAARDFLFLTRKHIVDECPIYENWRKNTIRRLRQGGFRISNKTNLE